MEAVAPPTGRRTTGIVVQAAIGTEVLDLSCDRTDDLEHLGAETEAVRYWRAGCSDELPAQF